MGQIKNIKLHIVTDIKCIKTSCVRMGAYKYLQELYKKKQSDLLRFLFRIRCWQLRHLAAIHRASRPTRPDKARRLGYKARSVHLSGEVPTWRPQEARAQGNHLRQAKGGG